VVKAASEPRWAAAASEFRVALGARAQLGQSYGPGERQKYDMFLPESAPKGTVIFVHGGYWRAFNRSSWSHLAAGPLAHGWAGAMPSYDLCPEVSISEISRQMAAAVQAVAGRTKGPISLIGHSAGGHLVARMLDPALIPDAVGARFHAVIPISPLSDLEPLMKTTMNDDFGLDRAEAQAESPLRMIDRHSTKVTVWVGGDERPAFLDQARWLAEGWRADHVIDPGKHHFDVIDALGDPASDMVRRLTS